MTKKLCLNLIYRIFERINMKKITVIICSAVFCLFALCSCTRRPLPDLPGDAFAFEMGTFIDDAHDESADFLKGS